MNVRKFQTHVPQSQCLEAGSLTPNLAADVAWASELHRMPKPKKPKQSAAQRMILSKSCETRDHRISLLWECLVNE